MRDHGEGCSSPRGLRSSAEIGKTCDTLTNAQNQTYLWVVVMLDLIESELYAAESLDAVLNALPRSVEQAYEKILSRCKDENMLRAEKLLHIVVGAVRPLTLAEMNVALAIEIDSIMTTDLRVCKPEMVGSVIKDLCGLFVTVTQDKVYLLHQTAREFLISTLGPIHHPKDISRPSEKTWRASLNPLKSHFILATSCINYLNLPEFEAVHWVEDEKVDYQIPESFMKEWTYHIYRSSECINEYPFVKYSAEHWVNHFRSCSHEGRKILLSSAMEIFRSGSFRLGTWLLAYQVTQKEYPQNWKMATSRYMKTLKLKGLIVAAYFGLAEVVELILSKKLDPINSRDNVGRTALI